MPVAENRSGGSHDAGGRQVNQELGQYKGYPLERSEWPERLIEVSEDGER
jgi:hypothetical protein